MKRIAMGFVWFFVLWLGILIIGGGITGFMAGLEAGAPGPGARSGYQAGQTFGERWGGLVALLSAGIAVIGTAKRMLPGTRGGSR